MHVQCALIIIRRLDLENVYFILHHYFIHPSPANRVHTQPLGSDPQEDASPFLTLHQFHPAHFTVHLGSIFLAQSLTLSQKPRRFRTRTASPSPRIPFLPVDQPTTTPLLCGRMEQKISHVKRKTNVVFIVVTQRSEYNSSVGVRANIQNEKRSN